MMKTSLRLLRNFTAGLWCAIWVAACAPQPSQQIEPTSIPSSIPLTPFQRATPTATIKPGQLQQVETPTPIPSLSPTPMIYQIVANDTLSGIANRHNVGLNDLIAANPNIDPNFITVGMEIVIPVSENLNTAVIAPDNQPTPMPITLEKPVCYPIASDSLWCFVRLTNQQRDPLEHIGVDFVLTMSDQSRVQAALFPLNLLPPQTSGLAAAYFSEVQTNQYQVEASLRTALPFLADETRYLTSQTQIEAESIASGGTLAQISGEVINTSSQTGSHTAVLLIAYDQNNIPIGFRKWVTETPIAAGAALPFAISVFSVGPAIDSISALSEIRP